MTRRKAASDLSFASTTVPFDPSRLIDAQEVRSARPTAKEGDA